MAFGACDYFAHMMTMLMMMMLCDERTQWQFCVVNFKRSKRV